MDNLSTVMKTLYVPMAGRIFASHNFAHILNDEKALMLEKKISESLDIFKGQSEYTLMASAVRSMNMDSYVKNFLSENPNGTIVNLGCGLETAFYRCDNGTSDWYELDMPEVIALRERLLEKDERDRSIACSMFDEEWLDIIKINAKDKAVLFIASGLFYYFEKNRIVELIKKLSSVQNAQLVFDTVNSKGMKRMGAYMKQLGHKDAGMYFFVDDAKLLAREISNSTVVLEERDYFKPVKDKKGMKPMTKISMFVSDKLHMVKMISLKLS